MKVKKKPWTALFPCPVVLVTSVDSHGKANIITLAWVGTLCSDPPIVGLGIRPNRHSYSLIENAGEFVVNIPTTKILNETDFCGITSGKDIDKFEETGLTSVPAEKVKPPLIKECPLNMECVVKNKISLGVHYLFLGQVVRVHVDQDIIRKDGRINFTKMSPFVYNQGEYWNLKEKIGVHGLTKQ
jgi:flavin reductase (DIM6/NTAB) family NADH-FMN oxidoreductase RutF